MKQILLDLMDNKERIKAHRDVLVPDIRWDSSRKKSEIIE